MRSLFGVFLVLVCLNTIKSDLIENELDVVDGVKADPTTIIHDSNLPTAAEFELIAVIQDVHFNYLSNKLKAQAVSGGFTLRSYYCAWNVVIYPATIAAEVAIWPAVPKSGFALVLVDNTIFYFVFSSPQPSRRCEF